MTTTTKADAINGAMSIADDVAQGRLSPEDLEAQAIRELRQLVGEVVGEGDPLFPLQIEVARGVLAVDGIPADELSEWAAVARQKAGVPNPPPAPVSLPSDANSGQDDELEDDLDA